MNLEEINIEKILPQAHPFIMIDRVVDFKKGESLTAVKNVTANEWFFKNAGPMPHLPETLLVEAAAQTAVLFAVLNGDEKGADNSTFILGKIDAEFNGRAGIGDQMQIKTSNFKMMKTNGFIDVEVHVEAESIAKLNIFYSLMEKRPHG